MACACATGLSQNAQTSKYTEAEREQPKAEASSTATGQQTPNSGNAQVKREPGKQDAGNPAPAGSFLQRYFGTSAAGVTGDSLPECAQGFVWREAVSGDRICVTPAAREQARWDNAAAGERRQPGAYGPDTCMEGYVWRGLSPQDHVCVTPEVRQQALDDTRNHAARAVK
jgi:hypothetical protein